MKIYELLEKLKGVDETREVFGSFQTESMNSSTQKIINTLYDTDPEEIEKMTVGQAKALIISLCNLAQDCPGTEEVKEEMEGVANAAAAINGTHKFSISFV